MTLAARQPPLRGAARRPLAEDGGRVRRPRAALLWWRVWPPPQPWLHPAPRITPMGPASTRHTANKSLCRSASRSPPPPSPLSPALPFPTGNPPAALPPAADPRQRDHPVYAQAWPEAHQRMGQQGRPTDALEASGHEQAAGTTRAGAVVAGGSKTEREGEREREKEQGAGVDLAGLGARFVGGRTITGSPGSPLGLILPFPLSPRRACLSGRA